MSGGARKSPPQFPYLIDWACSSSGAWVSLVLEGVFGIEVALDGTVTANPQVSSPGPERPPDRPPSRLDDVRRHRRRHNPYA